MRRDRPSSWKTRPTAELIWERRALAASRSVWPSARHDWREQGNTVVIDSAFVSKAHAVIRYVAGQFRSRSEERQWHARNGCPIAMSVLAGDVEVGDQAFRVQRRPQDGQVRPAKHLRIRRSSQNRS